MAGIGDIGVQPWKPRMPGFGVEPIEPGLPIEPSPPARYRPLQYYIPPGVDIEKAIERSIPTTPNTIPFESIPLGAEKTDWLKIALILVGIVVLFMIFKER